MDKLYVVKRITDGAFADVRRISDGALQLYWDKQTFNATRLSRAKAQALATLMALAAAPFCETIIIEEDRP